jgi:hypothetical protein
MKVLRALAISLTLGAVLFASVRSHAQTSQPVEDWPYRLVISGPTAAEAGSEAAYRVEYTLLVPGAIQSPGFVFGWNVDHASLVSSRVVAGPQGVMNPMTPNSIAWDFSQPAPSGAVEVVLRFASTFTGDSGVGIYVRGTQILLPEGSVDSFTTIVTAREALPVTGAGPSSSPPGLPLAAFLLALFGALGIAASGPLRLRRAFRARA